MSCRPRPKPQRRSRPWRRTNTRTARTRHTRACGRTRCARRPPFFFFYAAKTGEDITRGVLTQIIVEEEGKGRAMLPTSFLRHLIGFYGDSVQNLVPRYLEQSMAAFAHQQ